MKQILSFLILLPALCSANDLKINGLFTNNMVLQHGVAIPVWGTATPGKTITIEFDDQQKKIRTSEDGEWIVYLDPLAVDKTPGVMKIRDDSLEIKINNILVGEVWLCSGQSNMGMVLREADNAEKVISAADFPKIRLFNVPERPAEEKCKELKGQWTVCSPKEAGSFSATAFFFGKNV